MLLGQMLILKLIIEENKKNNTKTPGGKNGWYL